MSRLFLGAATIALLGFVVSAEAVSVDWKGLTWELTGTGTTAAVNISGGLDITVVGDGVGNDSNQVLHSLLPSNLVQANSPWIEFKFIDPMYGGPRAFVETDHMGWNTVWEGGIEPGFSKYILHRGASEGGVSVPHDWYIQTDRVAGEHTIKFGMHADGTVDFFFDGELRMTTLPIQGSSLFQRMHLGISAPRGIAVTGTYTDLSYGTGYGVEAVPEPFTMALGAAALGLAVAKRRRRA